MRLPIKVLGVAGAMTAAAAATARVARSETSPGDEPTSMPVRGHVDPPGWFDDYSFDGSLAGGQLDAKFDPRGPWNTVHVTGRVDGAGYDTRIDNQGWGGVTTLRGARQGDGSFSGSVDRPGLWNGATLRVSETVHGASIVRDGHFDESLTPSFAEASWHSEPVDAGGPGRTLDFDPPGWGNTTHVSLEGDPPAGVEASIATHLYDQWKTEQERQAQQDSDYPDTSTSGGTSGGDDY
jgi:hypothetical protein